jgi:hypothetical protein
VSWLEENKKVGRNEEALSVVTPTTHRVPQLVKSYITTAITTGPLMVRDVTLGTLRDYKHTYKFCMNHFMS